MADKLRVAVMGAGGRMGRSIIASLLDTEEAVLSAAIEDPESSLVGSDSGEVAGVGKNGIAISSDLSKVLDSIDAVIDFTRPLASMQTLVTAKNSGKLLVLGTTGFVQHQIQKIEAASVQIPICFSSNYSIGVNLVFSLLKKAATVLKGSDVEIVEAHHNKKVDAPSGTAVSMGRVIAEAQGLDFDAVAVKGRNGIVGARKKDTIGFSSIRAGDIVGEHTAMFVNGGEAVEITHKAFSRRTFSDGAVKAALWLRGQKPGLYSMTDVLGLN